MKWIKHIRTRKGKRYLRDYIRLVFAFYGCLLVLGVYQQVRLYGQGVLDSVLNQNLLLLWMHHLGFTAVVSLLFSFVFQNLEKWRQGLGFRFSALSFMVLLLAELLLTEYFIVKYELPEITAAHEVFLVYSRSDLLMTAVMGLMVLSLFFRVFYGAGKRYYRIIARMYPFTLVLFSLFLATLWSDKKPVNRNKTEAVSVNLIRTGVGRDVYEGGRTYPFYSDWQPADPLGPYLNWPQDPPNIVIIAIEGLGGEFVGEQSPFRGFTPFLDSLRSRSLFWENFLGNARESQAALTAITASLPQREGGTTVRVHPPRGLSVFSLLKKNGYRTSFQYGGNATLAGWDRFLYGESVDEVSDQKAFGKQFKRQAEDAAGVSLGYPDGALFERYLSSRPQGSAPRLDYIQTLSSREPYLFPGADRYLAEVRHLAGELPLSHSEQRIFRKNEELIAALRYTDSELRRFFNAISSRDSFGQTIFIITGTHHPSGLAADEPPAQYQVPLIVYSPLVKRPLVFADIASHMDLAPSILGSLSGQYPMKMPERAAWLGGSVHTEERTLSGRQIPLFKSRGGVAGFIRDEILFFDGDTYRLGPGLNAVPAGNLNADELEKEYHLMRAAQRYAIEEDALIPREAVPFESRLSPPGKRDLVWIQSVFNGTDFDNAFRTARQLALDGNRERAVTLCNYILSEVPGHVDSEILLGRIHSWEGDYGKATDILEGVVQKYPTYADGYSALLDVYHWSGQDEKAPYLRPSIEENLGDNPELLQKMRRASEEIQNDGRGTEGQLISQNQSE